MNANVREMRLDEVGIVIEYFHGATPEYLEALGVDPTRLPERAVWHEQFAAEFANPIESRPRLMVMWELDGRPVGFSSADKITIGVQANMHLHVVEPDLRRQGIGETCVRKTARLYFAALRVQRLFCEPNAFNVAPNRTLQRAGFAYVKTHNTVPAALNFHQPVTRWILERPADV